MAFDERITTRKRSRQQRSPAPSYEYLDEIRALIKRKASTGGIPQGVETRIGSSVLRVHASLLNEENGEDSDTFRLIHLPIMVGFSQGNPVRSSVFASVQGALLAQQHFNRRSDSVVPNMRELLTDENGKECNLRMTLEFYDTARSPRTAAKLLSQNVFQRGFPYEASAIVGAVRSSVSLPMAILNTVKELPQVSYASTSTAFDDREKYAMFGRTIPSTDGDAEALIDYYRDLGLERFGILYVQDEYGISYRRSMERAAMRYGIEVCSAGIKVDQSDLNQYGLRDGIVDGVAALERMGYRYFVGIVYDQHMNDLVAVSSQAGIMGPGYFWLFGDGISESCLTSLQYPEGSAMTKALHGVGLIRTGVPPLGGNLERFKTALVAEDDEEFRSYYANKMVSFALSTLECSF